ncbi:T-cell activation inhibitor, mitochondrial [Varanus komodoensis]|nr:T-cell activation inhibitor, mitochondrial [Varanus komodoensis]
MYVDTKKRRESEHSTSPAGRTVIFTDHSGMSAAGQVMLGTMDVHHHWTKIFERLPSYSTLQRKVLLLEEHISHLLGGIQITYVEELQPMLTLEEYYSALDNFYNRVCNSRLAFHPRSLRGLQMILEREEQQKISYSLFLKRGKHAFSIAEPFALARAAVVMRRGKIDAPACLLSLCLL